MKNLLSYINMCNDIITFGDMEIEKKISAL